MNRSGGLAEVAVRAGAERVDHPSRGRQVVDDQHPHGLAPAGDQVVVRLPHEVVLVEHHEPDHGPRRRVGGLGVHLRGQAEVQAGVHIQLESAVGVDVGPEQRVERPPVLVGQLAVLTVEDDLVGPLLRVKQGGLLSSFTPSRVLRSSAAECVLEEADSVAHSPSCPSVKAGIGQGEPCDSDPMPPLGWKGRYDEGNSRTRGTDR
jgi:hypothetical protein